jgi:hypothetical protein
MPRPEATDQDFQHFQAGRAQADGREDEETVWWFGAKRRHAIQSSEFDNEGIVEIKQATQKNAASWNPSSTT